MERITYKCVWLPGIDEERFTDWREMHFASEKDDKHEVTVRYPVLTPELLRESAAQLKKNREKFLLTRTVAEILDVFARASELWLDPQYKQRRDAVKWLPVITGYSPEMVGASIDVEENNYLRHSLERAMISEFGNPEVLDRFVPNEALGGYRRAIGPELTGIIFSGNIPALPTLSIIRSLLVKSACLGKVASGEPLFSMLYMNTINELDPEIAQCIGLTYWPGSGEEGETITGALFNEADAAIIYGGDDSLGKVRKFMRPGMKVVEHGHKVGFGYIDSYSLTEANLDALARDAAYDVTMFDQQACIAPQLYFVRKGGEVSPVDFAARMAEAMGALAEELPRGTIELDDAATVNRMRKSTLYAELMGENVKVFHPENSAAWTVLYEDGGAFKLSPLNRMVRVVAVDDLEHLYKLLEPARNYFQNAALSVNPADYVAIAEHLAHLGVNRICKPGKMPVPSMMWRHDGKACISDLVRWVDIEMSDPYPETGKE